MGASAAAGLAWPRSHFLAAAPRPTMLKVRLTLAAGHRPLLLLRRRWRRQYPLLLLWLPLLVVVAELRVLQSRAPL